MRRVERILREKLKKQVSITEYYKKENDELRDDRTRFRDHFARRFKWWIELMGKSQTANMAWLIENDAKFVSTVAWWSW